MVSGILLILFRNAIPLNGIRGMVTIARESLHSQEKEAECLDKIMTSSDYLLELVNDAKLLSNEKEVL